MDNPNITMKEYIRLKEEKSRRRGKVYNWETATYGKIWDNEDIHDLGSVETEFPAIVFNDTLTSEAALSCEPTVSSLNNDEIDFRISFNESDDEDCTVIFDKNSFSYKIIYVNDLKTDSKNDSDKVIMPLLPSPEPTVSYFDDLDFFKDFENEFPAIVYNDALTSKSDFLTEHTIRPCEGKSTNVGGEFTNLEILKCSMLYQQAKVEWLKEGDKNTTYFHQVVKGRKHKSHIDTVCDEQGSVKEINNIDELCKVKVTSCEAKAMCGNVTADEIREALTCINENKALGPNGYTAKNFKAAWSIMGKDVVEAVREFF
ncbi:hypothetical protein Tco_0992894 [Tanacetum coccineum]|uniref:Uncharacterized protein n=1 Tax=Tanacetum coccineum TaxID=301880 RepID=A0ABQ5F4S7_9ASTR